MLASLLAALFKVPKGSDLPVGWHWRPPRGDLTWRGWLSERLVDDPREELHGWRAALAARRDLDRVYRAGEARVRDLIEACPERRDLIHGDLLHANVLVAEDATRPNAVFSWKCSRGWSLVFPLPGATATTTKPSNSTSEACNLYDPASFERSLNTLPHRRGFAHGRDSGTGALAVDVVDTRRSPPHQPPAGTQPDTSCRVGKKWTLCVDLVTVGVTLQLGAGSSSQVSDRCPLYGITVTHWTRGFRVTVGGSC